MGCINSKKLTDRRRINNNVFRTSAVRLQPDTPSDTRNGILELTPRELSFTTQGTLIVWTLAHLRRYGVNGNVFSFEAGRRCMKGPGIYRFRCEQAERLYLLFQRYINSVLHVADDTVVSDREMEHLPHALGRPDHSHPNNYLEPAPLRSILHESFGQTTLNLDLDSYNSMPNVTAEDAQFQNHQNSQQPPVSFSSNYNANVYLEHPLRGPQHNEHNNNTANDTTRKFISKQLSLDAPPDDIAPMLSVGEMIDALHMYANVDGLGTTRDNDRIDPVERCYENLGRSDVSPMLFKTLNLQRDSPNEQQHVTLTSVNYIVLDLDQQSSPKTCFGSGFSLESEPFKPSADPNLLVPALADKQQPIMISNTTTKTEYPQTSKIQKNVDASLGYSTIDFIKTCALIKSSTHGADFDPDHDNESRITRHSKCVRKSYSISE